MRIPRFLLLAAGVTLAAAFSNPSIRAQAVGASFGVVGVGAVDIEANGVALTGVPYTANRKTTHVQKLADGTTITHVMLGKEARDSEGRTYNERHIEASPAADEARVTVHYFLHDPAARTTTSWSSNLKVASVFHMPEPATRSKTGVQSLNTPNGEPRPIRMVETRPDVEKLGTKTIEGVVAEGTRTTRVIPAGREGNDQPLTVTRERWYSAELKLTVLMINDDPRTGTTTMELSDIVPGDPDPSLFKVPEGYEIRERTPGQLEPVAQP